VGSETMRTATHAIGIERGTTVFFLFYTIFPNALRLYANTIHAPVVPQDEVRELNAEEGEEIDAFIERFKAKAKPTRPYRDAKSRPWIGWKVVARHLWTQIYDRNNEYMQPIPWFLKRRKERLRGILARRLYQPLREGRKTVYFPLHVTDDYKIKRVIPHCVDQASLIEQIADSLPHGYDIVLKEHPMSIGRNDLKLLQRLRRIPNARLVDPFMSSHELMKSSEAIMVISSTVGLEALMYGQPVLTLGQPFYSGYGLTVDVDSFSEIRDKVPATFEFKPDPERVRRFLHAASRRCYPSDPFIVDFSDENARKLADSLETAARERSAAGPQDSPAVTSPPDHAAAAITGTP
jgi:Capsule polysaccharide biosynthesis protein